MHRDDDDVPVTILLPDSPLGFHHDLNEPRNALRTVLSFCQEAGFYQFSSDGENWSNATTFERAFEAHPTKVTVLWLKGRNNCRAKNARSFAYEYSDVTQSIFLKCLCAEQ